MKITNRFTILIKQFTFLIFTIIFSIIINFGLNSQKVDAISYSTDYINRRVLLLVYNPTVTDGGQKLIVNKGWNNPENISNQLISFFNNNSHGVLNFQIVQRLELDDFITFNDGYKYTKEAYMTCINGGSCYSSANANYTNILSSNDVCGKVNRGEIDEVWIFAGPNQGLIGNAMTGTGSYGTNVISGAGCGRAISVMSFNFQNGQNEGIVSFGSRTDTILNQLYGGLNMNSDSNNWNKFAMNSANTSAFANMGCGTSQFAPNSSSAGDYSNSTVVNSFCNKFFDNWPNIDANTSSGTISCSEWGCNGYGYLAWWFGKIPAYNGVAPDGKYSSWWKYIADPNRVYEVASCTPSCGGKQCGAEDGCGGRCATGICNTPPSNSCVSNKNLRLHYNSGTCKPDYTCEYTYKDLYCAFGCNNSSLLCNGCTPSCTGKECGSDGCGGLCGACGAGKVCDTTGKCGDFTVPLSIFSEQAVEIVDLHITDFETGEKVTVTRPKSIVEYIIDAYDAYSNWQYAMYVNIALLLLVILVLIIVLAIILKKRGVKIKIKLPFSKNPDSANIETSNIVEDKVSSNDIKESSETKVNVKTEKVEVIDKKNDDTLSVKNEKKVLSDKK